jgi:hypothetical protein
MPRRVKDIVEVFEENERRYHPRWKDLTPRADPRYDVLDELDELDELAELYQPED